VNRLGEFSPIGWLFSLGSFCENYKSNPNNWDGYIFHGKRYLAIFTKNELGYIWATYSEMHPVKLLISLKCKLITSKSIAMYMQCPKTLQPCGTRTYDRLWMISRGRSSFSVMQLYVHTLQKCWVLLFRTLRRDFLKHGLWQICQESTLRGLRMGDVGFS
jgi:hypothetical protein